MAKSRNKDAKYNNFYNNKQKEIMLETTATVTSTIKSTATDKDNNKSSMEYSESSMFLRRLTNTMSSTNMRKTYFANNMTSPNLLGDDFSLEKKESQQSTPAHKNSSFELSPIKRNTVFDLNRKPSLFKGIDKGKKMKRRKIMKPLTHCPLREREVNSSDDDLHESLSEEEVENKQEEVVEKEEREEGPQTGVESGAQKVDYDSLAMVYKNVLDSEEVDKPQSKPEKPVHRRKKSILLAQSREFSVHLNSQKKNKEKYRFNLEEVKQYIDSLEDYEKWKKEAEKKEDVIEIPVKGCAGGGCNIF